MVASSVCAHRRRDDAGQSDISLLFGLTLTLLPCLSQSHYNRTATGLLVARIFISSALRSSSLHELQPWFTLNESLKDL